MQQLASEKVVKGSGGDGGLIIIQGQEMEETEDLT